MNTNANNKTVANPYGTKTCHGYIPRKQHPRFRGERIHKLVIFTYLIDTMSRIFTYFLFKIFAFVTNEG